METGVIKFELQKLADPERAKILQRFFKTGPGEYGKGDIFIGITVPEIRKKARKFKDISFDDVLQLLRSKYHEERLLALLILIQKYKKGNISEKKEIYNIYLKNIPYINNWDLIDLSAQYIVGVFLEDEIKNPLYKLAGSSNLWERRIAIMSTFHYIRLGKFTETIIISEMLLNDEQDLIGKAVGWMLREVGKRDLSCEELFLKKYYRKMPRTMLRYAIKLFPEEKRQQYLKGEI